MSVHYNITADNKDFKRKFGEVRNDIRQSGVEAEKTSQQIANSVKKAGALIAGAFSVYTVKAFATQLINVRSEMQMLEASFETLLGGKAKADKYIQEIKEYAVLSPLDINQVSKAAQTLLGFNIEAGKTIPIIKQIGDISMGDAGRFQSLTLAFAQMSATGKLMGQDLLQMINAGFNPLQQISAKTGKSISELKQEMEKGAISTKMVEEAFRSATAEGGKFYGMTKKQAEGIKGLQAQLRGGFLDMYNEMGESQEGFIAEGYKGAIKLVENYEKVGKTLAVIIATFGTYKAAVIVTNLVLKEQAAINAMVAASNGVFNKGLATQWVWTERLQKANKALNKTMLTNPYVLAATLIVALAGSIYLYTQRATEAERATEALNNQLDEQNKRIADERNELQELINTLQSETSTRLEKQKSLEDLQKLMPGIFGNLDVEKAKTVDLTETVKLHNEQIERRMILEAKEKLNRAKELSTRKEGAFRWTRDERREALQLMGKDAGFKDINRFTIDGEEKVFKEWIKQREDQLKDLEDISKRAATIEDKPTTDTPKDDPKEKKQVYDATLDIEQERINAMKEGFKKQQAQIELNHEKRLADLKANEKAMTNAQLKEREYLSQQLMEFEKQSLYAGMISEFQGFSDGRLAIEKSYQEKRATLIEETRGRDTDAAAAALKELNSQEQAALIAYEDNFTSKSEAVIGFVEETARYSLEQLRSLLFQLQAELSMTNFKGLSDESVAVLKAQIKELEDQIANFKKEASDEPIKASEWKKSLQTVKQVDASLRKASEAISELGGAPAQILDAAMGVSGALISMISGLELLAVSGAEAIKGVERASVILAVISAGLQIVQKIFSLVNQSNEVSQTSIDYYNTLIAVTDELINKQKQLIAELSGSNAAIKAQHTLLLIDKQEQASREMGKEYLDSGGSLFKHAYGKRIIADFTKQNITTLERVLGMSLKSLGGTLGGLFDLPIDKLEKLKYEAPAVWAKLGSEVTDYLNAIIDTEKKREEILNAEKSAKTGIDFDDALGSLDDFLLSADRGFEKVTESWANYMKSSMIKAVKDQYMNKALESWYDQFATYTEGGLTQAETDKLEKSYQNIAKEAQRRFDDMLKVAGLDQTSSKQEQGAATFGAYEKITSDQADRIDGRLTGIHMNTTQILEANEGIKSVSEEMYKLAFISVEHLEQIKKNTALLNKTNGILNKIDNNTRNL